jgi:hypothetical protein
VSLALANSGASSRMRRNSSSSECLLWFFILPSLRSEILIALAFAVSAEDAASVSSSASCYDLPEHISMIQMVAAKLELSQVERQIFFADMVKLAHDAALQERPKRINARSVNQSAHVFALPMSYALVVVLLIEQTIAGMFISREKRNLWTNGLAHKSIQGRGVRVFNHLANDVALTSDRADNGDLAACATSADSLAGVFILLFAADIGFINFNLSQELTELFIFHRSANAVAHIPSGFIRTHAEHALNLKRAHAFFAVVHQEDNFKPGAQRIFGVFKHSAGDNREAPTVLIADFANPMERAVRNVKNFLVLTNRTLNTIGPTLHGEICFARRFVGKLCQQLIKCHAGEYSNELSWCQHPDNRL